MQHLQLNRGTVSLTERLLRSERPAIAGYLRNAMLASEAERIDLLLPRQHLTDIHRSLESLYASADSGDKSLLSHLRERWLQAFCTE